MAPPTMGWPLPHQPLIKEMPYKIAYGLLLLLIEGIFLVKVPSSQVTSSCQVDIRFLFSPSALIVYITNVSFAELNLTSGASLTYERLGFFFLVNIIH